MQRITILPSVQTCDVKHTLNCTLMNRLSIIPENRCEGVVFNGALLKSYGECKSSSKRQALRQIASSGHGIQSFTCVLKQSRLSRLWGIKKYLPFDKLQCHKYGGLVGRTCDELSKLFPAILAVF